ncbi:MAG: protein kinase domain-containing protein [Janthinobacterium lividum]
MVGFTRSFINNFQPMADFGAPLPQHTHPLSPPQSPIQANKPMVGCGIASNRLPSGHTIDPASLGWLPAHLDEVSMEHAVQAIRPTIDALFQQIRAGQLRPMGGNPKKMFFSAENLPTMSGYLPARAELEFEAQDASTVCLSKIRLHQPPSDSHTFCNPYAPSQTAARQAQNQRARFEVQNMLPSPPVTPLPSSPKMSRQSSLRQASDLANLGDLIIGERIRATKALPLLWTNDDLDKVGNGILKSYTLFRQHINSPYRSQRKHGEKMGNPGIHQKIGNGANNTVISRRNENSSYFLKVPRHVVEDMSTEDIDVHDMEDLLDRNEMLNNLTATLCRNDSSTANIRQHFAVEIMKEIRGAHENPIPVFLTPRVTGFGLDEFVRDPYAFASHLPAHALTKKLDEMRVALDWMHGNGFVHNDIKLSNVMYDINQKKLVLIDFECADEIGQADPDHDMDLDSETNQRNEDNNDWEKVASIVKEAAEIDTPMGVVE